MTRPKWKFYTGDLNWLEYGGTWLKRYDDCFEFVELWQYAGDEKYILFQTSLSLEDIAMVRDDVKYAMNFCSLELDEYHDPAEVAYALFSYSRHDHAETGNNAYKMLRSWGIYRP